MTQVELIRQRVEIFFTDLTHITGTYFLSDYVEEIYGYVGQDTTDAIVSKRDELQKICNQNGLDMHAISQRVAAEFLDKEDGKN